MQTVKLNNGIKMPVLGYGVYQVSNEECERCVLDALCVGYRSIDTAQAYGNEEAVGNAIRKCGVPREELFITTKVWVSNAGYKKAKESLRESLQDKGSRRTPEEQAQLDLLVKGGSRVAFERLEAIRDWMKDC